MLPITECLIKISVCFQVVCFLSPGVQVSFSAIKVAPIKMRPLEVLYRHIRHLLHFRSLPLEGCLMKDKPELIESFLVTDRHINYGPRGLGCPPKLDADQLVNCNAYGRCRHLNQQDANKAIEDQEVQEGHTVERSRMLIMYCCAVPNTSLSELRLKLQKTAPFLHFCWRVRMYNRDFLSKSLMAGLVAKRDSLSTSDILPLNGASLSLAQKRTITLRYIDVILHWQPGIQCDRK